MSWPAHFPTRTSILQEWRGMGKTCRVRPRRPFTPFIPRIADLPRFAGILRPMIGSIAGNDAFPAPSAPTSTARALNISSRPARPVVHTPDGDLVRRCAAVDGVLEQDPLTATLWTVLQYHLPAVRVIDVDNVKVDQGAELDDQPDRSLIPVTDRADLRFTAPLPAWAGARLRRRRR